MSEYFASMRIYLESGRDRNQLDQDWLDRIRVDAEENYKLFVDLSAASKAAAKAHPPADESGFGFPSSSLKENNNR